MKIITLKMLGILPDEYPDTCECGFAFETDGADGKFTNIYCTNPNCIFHTMFLIPKVLEKLGIKAQLGENKAKILLENFKLKSHLDMFGLENELLPSSVSLPVLRSINELKKINDLGGITLAQYISLWCFDTIGDTRSYRIFETYSTLDEFYDDFDKNSNTDIFHRKEFIAKFLGIGAFNKTVDEIIKTLVIYRAELYRCLKYFKIRPVSNVVIRVCITGEITKVLDDNGKFFKPRDKFVDYIANKYSINVILAKQFTNDVDFLICDANISTSSKYKKAVKLQRKDRYARDVLLANGQPVGNRVINSSDFVDMLNKGEY